MIEIRTTLTPFKMRLSRREPVTLSVELTNNGSEPEIVSFELDLGGQFSFEKTGFKGEAVVRIPEFKAGESKKFYYDLWPKQMARAGEQSIRATITEHYRGFNYVKRKHDKSLKIAVEE